MAASGGASGGAQDKSWESDDGPVGFEELGRDVVRDINHFRDTLRQWLFSTREDLDFDTKTEEVEKMAYRMFHLLNYKDEEGHTILSHLLVMVHGNYLADWTAEVEYLLDKLQGLGAMENLASLKDLVSITGGTSVLGNVVAAVAFVSGCGGNGRQAKGIVRGHATATDQENIAVHGDHVGSVHRLMGSVQDMVEASKGDWHKALYKNIFSKYPSLY